MVVAAGGWLFYGLYAACQQWWFLVICLSIWGFVLVALSFWLSGREFLFPVALVTAFIGECGAELTRGVSSRHLGHLVLLARECGEWLAGVCPQQWCWLRQVPGGVSCPCSASCMRMLCV